MIKIENLISYEEFDEIIDNESKFYFSEGQKLKITKFFDYVDNNKLPHNIYKEDRDDKLLIYLEVVNKKTEKLFIKKRKQQLEKKKDPYNSYDNVIYWD